MNTQTSSAAILAMLFALCGGLVPSARADALSEAFSNPPPSARPHTWYHLMNGNVTKAGITRDFEALARLGIGGVQMFDAGCAIPPGDLKFNSPEWFDMFRHAAAEARRLGLELCIPNCSGWSSSGGPWNTPTNAMKTLCCREIALRGPRRFADVLPRDAEDNGFYADIAVVAFPTPPAEHAAYPQVRTTLEKNGFTLAADEPFEARGMSFRLDYPIVWTDRLPVTVSVSQDGHTFAPLEDYMEILAQHGVCDRTLRYHAFPAPVKVRAIRARFGKAKVKCVAKEAHPEAKLAISSLRAKTFAFRDEFPTPRDTAIATPAQVVPGDKVVDLTGKMSADGKLEWDVPPGDWTVVRVGYKCNGRCNHPASEKGKGLEVDKLSAAALDYHIDQYVTKLCRHLGPLAGAVESGFNNVLVDSYEVGSQNWTQGFEKTFEKRMGYSLLRYLPVFAGRIVGSVDETERFLEDFRRTVADEFTANYPAALARKCHSLGLKLSLEPYGNCPADNLQYGEFADIPMGELWSHANEGNFNTDEGNARVPAYVAHVWGRKIAATESFTTAAQPYGSGRWLTTPFALKAQCDRIYARGVNRIIYHRFAHQPWADDRYLPGMTMGLYGMHFDRTQTWWNFADGWIRYQTRCQAMLQAGEYVADALFYCGGEAPNQGGNPGGHRQFGDNPDLMLPPGYSWDVCPKSAFMRLAVKDGRVVAPGGLSYPLLVLPPNETMGADELEQLAKLLAAGAKVCGRVRPTRAPGLSGGADADGKVAARARQVWAQGVMELQPVEALAKLGLGPDFAAPGMVMDGDTGLAFTHRRAADADWYFVAMPNRGPVSFEASFRISGRIPEIWDAEKGTIQRAREWREENGHTVVRLDFQTSGSAFVVFREKTPPDLPAEKRYDLVESLAVKGPWNVAFPNGFRPNVLAEGPDEIVEFPVLSDWKDHANEGIRYFSGTATYKCKMENVKCKMEGVPGKDRVVLDLGEVREVAEVTVNGKTYPALWKPPYRVDITDALRVVSNAPQGETNISIEVKVANLWPNRLIGDDRTCADDCEWNEWGGVVKIPDWVKRGEKSPTGRLTFTTWKHWKKNDPLQPSGLLGPVSLRLETEAPPTGSAAFRSRKRILEKPLVVTQTQFYPLREQPRGYLGRYANQPLMIDPDLPEDPNREGIGDFPGWGNFHSQADYDLTLQAIKDSGLDGAAIFAARHRRFFSSAADCPVQGSVVVPILLLSSPNVTNDFSDIENVLANPRNFKIGGKILCLSYRMSQSNTPDLLKAKLAAIREKYGDRFLFVCALPKPAQMWHVFEGNGRMMSVQLRRMIEDEARAYARVADGISIGEAHMLAKFENGERAFGEMFWRQIHEIVAGVLAEPEFNGKKLFCSSAVNAHMNPTWNGHNTAENGTRTLRDSLGSAIAAGVDAILLPEWDEFNENTCFCPTLYGSFATRRILRHCVSAAKGRLPEPMPGDDATRPNLIVSYRKTLTPGELLAIEVLNVPDGTRRGMLALEVELTDEKGTPVKTFDKALVDEGTFAELRFEVDTATLAPKVRCAWVRLRWRNGANGGALEEGLHPIDLVPGGEWSHLCVKQPIRDIVRPKKADVSLREGRMAADFALDEPIRYAMLCGDGCIQAIAGRPGSAPDRFREDESNAVFQITGFSCAQSFKAKKGREHSYRVRGCAEAEWLCMKDTVRGERFAFDVLHGNGCAPQVFLRMPKAKLKGAVLRCDFPNVWRCEIPLDEAFRLGAYGADCAGRGLQVTVARFMRQSRYPSVANDRTCAFDLPVDADRNSMAYHVQLVTMRGKVWYSRPFVSEKQGGASTMSVWDVMREAVVPVAFPSSRVPHLEYDFSPVAGTVVLPRSGERHWMGMLGGPFTPATLWNRGSLTVGAVRSHSPFRRDPKRKSVPARQQEPDGSWSLVFDGVDDYVGFPWTVIPSFAGFTVEMDVFPESREDGKPGSLLSSDLALRNLGLDAQGELVLSYVGMPRCDGYRTGLRLQAGKWSHLRLVCTGDSLNLSVDGETAGPFPIGLPGISTTPLTLGGSPKPDRGFFRGRIRNLSIDHAVSNKIR